MYMCPTWLLAWTRVGGVYESMIIIQINRNIHGTTRWALLKDAQVEIRVTHVKQMRVIALEWVNYIILCVVYEVLALIKNMLRFSSVGVVWVMLQ